jgi:hypothetical protein
MVNRSRMSRAAGRIATINVIVFVGLVTAWPSVAQAEDRGKAKVLHKAAKKQRKSGDLDGALKSYVEAHKHFANLKVAQWIVARYLETGHNIEAASFLEKMIEEKRPKKGVKWAKSALEPLKAVVEEAKKAEAAAKAKADADAKAKSDAEAQAKAAADAQAAEAAAAKAKADAASAAASAEKIRVAAAEQARAEIKAEFEKKAADEAAARTIPTQLLIWGGSVGALGLIAYSVFGVKAADKRTKAAECYSSFLQEGEVDGCAEAKYASLDSEAQDQDGFANIAAVTAGLGVTTAIVGGIMLWRAGVPDDDKGGEGSAGDTLMVVPGPGGAWLTGSF